MKITYTARKVNLKDNFKSRAEKKLLKFERLFSENATAIIVVTLEKNRQIVEVTIKDNGMVYRAESTMAEMNDALDKVVDVLARQIRKNKTKLEKKMRTGSFEDFISQTQDINDVPEDEFKIVREKNIIVKPITTDEAILEMNMVNHNFFMFINSDTDTINVVYKRTDGNYGLLEPSVE